MTHRGATGVALRASDALRWAAMRNDFVFRACATWGSGGAQLLSAPAAARTAHHAMKHVPAYRDFAAVHAPERRGSAADFIATLPVSDKRSYIDHYPLADRCVDGVIPTVGTQLDESSGSSGVPYTWARGASELHELHMGLSRLARQLFGDNLVTLNGFSMGAWATGTNASAALGRNGMVKSTGPDVEKILSALELLGPQYTYVIAGYPPFLRELLNAGDAAGFDWSPYRMYGVVGGEGMSETLRARLEQRFCAVYSAYGASDLDIGVASELPLSVWIRRRASENAELARALFGSDRRVPMVFQYNPLDYYVETNESSELVVTVNRRSMLSPRIRYNIHDVGGTIPFVSALSICRDFGLNPLAALDDCEMTSLFRLPFLYVHGRSDSTVSYMGSNIYPEDVEQALFRDADARDADRIGSFCLELVDLPDAAVRPCVHIEVDNPDDDPLAVRLAADVRRRLLMNSRDFRAAVAEDPATAEIVVALHRPGAGPFVENTRRIKNRYVIRGGSDVKAAS